MRRMKKNRNHVIKNNNNTNNNKQRIFGVLGVGFRGLGV